MVIKTIYNEKPNYLQLKVDDDETIFNEKLMLMKLITMIRQWWWNYSKWKVDGDETILTTTKLAFPPSTDPIPECKKEEPQTEADIWYCSNYLSERVFLLFGIFHINSCNYHSRTKTKRFKLGQMISPCFLVSCMKISCFVKHWSCNKLIDLRLLLVCLYLIWNFHFKGWATPLHRLDKLHEKTWEINQNS